MSESTDGGNDPGGGSEGRSVATDGSDGDGESRLRRVGKMLALGISSLVLLVVLLFVLGVLGLPETELADNRWGEVNDQDVEVITEVEVENPNPFGFGGQADVTYDVELEAVRLAEGEGTGLSVDSGENSLNFSTTLFAENLSTWWSRHLNNAEVSGVVADATADASLGPLSGSHSTTIEDEIETDIEGALDESSDEFEGEYSLARSGLDIEPSVTVDDATTEWGAVTNDTTEIVTNITITNDNEVTPIPTPAFAGGIEMNGEPLVEWAASEVRVLDASGNELVGDRALIPPGETEQRTFIAEMDNENVSVWFPTHVDREQPESNPGVEFSEMVVTAQLAFELNGERFTIPPGGQAIACEFDMATTIFVDQDGGIEPRGCGLTEFEQPSEQLEAVGATLDEEEGDPLP